MARQQVTGNREERLVRLYWTVFGLAIQELRHWKKQRQHVRRISCNRAANTIRSEMHARTGHTISLVSHHATACFQLHEVLRSPPPFHFLDHQEIGFWALLIVQAYLGTVTTNLWSEE